MKYKTLFRLVLKVFGVFYLAQGVIGISESLIGVVGYMVSPPPPTSMPFAFDPWNFVYTLARPMVMAGAGAYLFLGGKWIVDKAIPSNRPYCPECAYDLTGLVGNRCPECGTEIPGRSNRSDESKPRNDSLNPT